MTEMITLHEGPGGKKSVKKPAEQALVLTLTVVGCSPRIWRRLHVRESMWLARLHDTIQVALDWYDYQMHTFTLDDLRLGNPGKQGGHLVEDDRDVMLTDIDLVRRGSMVYDYHFGEGWRVEIRVAEQVPLVKGRSYPFCEAGERMGPPEDCGGIEAYHDMLEAIKSPLTDLGREWLEWLGPDQDPEKCDVAAINKALKVIGKA